MDRPYVVLSAAVSLDGYLDDDSPVRRLLSNEADFDRVDELRASCDAILVGAATVRADDPRLLVRSPQRRARRVAGGRPPSPLKVTLTAGGDLDPAARFFTAGPADAVVYAASAVRNELAGRVGDRAAVVDGGEPVDLRFVLGDLVGRGVRRLMVEGGGSVLTAFLAAGLADELQVAVAPVLLGGGRRFVDAAASGRALELDGVTRLDDVVVLRYLT